MSKKSNIIFASGKIPEMAAKESGLEILEKNDSNGYLSYAVKQATGKVKRITSPRLALTENPYTTTQYGGLYKQKGNILPDFVKKQIRVQNSLVASIMRARGNMISMFGHIKKDRFDIGVEVAIKQEFLPFIKTEQMSKIKERIAKVEKILLNCGHTKGLNQEDRMGLSDFFDLQARNGLTFGWFSTEVIYERDGKDGKEGKIFNRFRPTDAGTIYYPRTKNDDQEFNSLRKSAIESLKKIKGVKVDIDIDSLEEDNYAYLQVINGIPQSAFASDELLVTNLYPSTDVEHNGYPVAPIDTAIAAITTHISIDTYNKLYFQNGRAAKGMLVVKSDEIDQSTVDNMKHEFFASINGVNNSFRVPIFAIAKDDDVAWEPMVSSTGDGEFQFLYDSVARNILAAFNMSPDELPGYGHLSRGTAQQTLSESSNEYKLESSRDTGIRPLILKFQAFLNERLFPLIDPELAQICSVNISGLDSQTREQEALRLTQEMPIHYTMDEMLTEVDKDLVGERLGGKMPMNERWEVIVDKAVKVGELRSRLFDDPAAEIDPLMQYVRDPFWLQSLQFIAQVNPAAVQAAFSSKAYSMDILKMLVSDSLEEELE